MKPFEEGLRCQDVHAGLRNVDPLSGALAPLMDTRLIGMAATLASLIRGQDVIADASALQAVAAEQLDVDLYAFDTVVGLLEELGYVDGVVRKKAKIERFTESVPFYSDLYAELGSAWRARGPSQLEEQVVAVVHRLAIAPAPLDDLVDELGLDTSDVPQLLDLGVSSHLLKRIRTPDGELIYSPFYAFENPKALDELVATYGNERLAEEFTLLHSYQGLPVDSATTPMLADAVARGFLMAPSVERPGGVLQPFATLPYVLSQDLLTVKKPILEKALAVIACLRCGQHFGGYNNLAPDALTHAINKLLDPNRGFLLPHESHRRQYGLMHRAGLIAFDADLRPGGRWVTPRFIDTPDNREALQIARDLLAHGEPIDDRLGDATVRGMLAEGGNLSGPVQTIARYRDKAAVDPKTWTNVVNAAMSRGPL
ncbi:MAG: hypothetical protein HY997_23515 [Mycolicibacterium neoaurum]|nr:hypothetical protein [Mycolicibacterium neoaurum]